jgi:hypothetical protein
MLRSARELASLPEVVLDPRLVLPVCAQTGSELTLSKAPENARQLSIFELYQRINNQRKDKGRAEELSDRPTQEKLRVIIDDLFLRLTPSERWKFLFKRLSLPVQAELVRGVSSSRPPNREDWINVFRPVSYTVKREWHAWMVVALYLIATGCVQFGLLKHSGTTTTSVITCIVLLLGVVIQIVILFADDNADETNVLHIMVIGPYFVYERFFNIRSMFRDSVRDEKFMAAILRFSLLILLVTGIAIWSPILTVTLFLTMRPMIGTAGSVAVIGLLFAMVFCLWLRAKSLQGRARNPMTGLRRFLVTDTDGNSIHAKVGPKLSA